MPTAVIPAHAGIQRSFEVLDSGSPQPEADLAGMTLGLFNEVWKHCTSADEEQFLIFEE